MIQCASPAKLNLFLRVLNARDDGYHDIATLFTAIDLYDSLDIQARSEFLIKLTGNCPEITLQDNLIYRAWLAFQAKSQCTDIPAYHVSLNKKIPSESGLGGASSNAATFLHHLNQATANKLDLSSLLSLARQIGADVPFFIQAKSAIGTAIGEHLTPVSLPNAYALVFAPNITLSTRTLFQDPELKPRPLSSNENDCLNQIQKAPEMLWEALEALSNDFEPMVRQRFPALHDFISLWASIQSSKPLLSPRMTGTGSSFFALYATKEDANSVCVFLKKHLTAHKSLAKIRLFSVLKLINNGV